MRIPLISKPQEQPEVLKESRGKKFTYRYRGWEFTIERRGGMWWCHDGISIPQVRDMTAGMEWLFRGPLDWALTSIQREDGWGRMSRKRLVRKLCLIVDDEIEDWRADIAHGDVVTPSAQQAAHFGLVSRT